MESWHPAWLSGPRNHWQVGTLDRWQLMAESAALAQRPGFGAIAQNFARLWLATQAANPELRAVFRNTARYLLLVNSVVMHHRRDPRDPRSGITPGRLLAFFEHDLRGVLRTSASQVKAMLAHARLHGLLQPVANGAGGVDTADARFRPLEPSPRLFAILRDWIHGFLSAAEAVPDLPRPAPPAVMVAVPDLVGEVFSARLAAATEAGFVLWQGLDGLDWIVRRDHGYRVFLHMVEAMQPQPDGTALVPLATAELARRAEATRGTVRNLLADAAAQGWFGGQRPAAEGWRLMAGDLRVTRDWIAREILWMHGLACVAYARCTKRVAGGGAAAADAAAGLVPRLLQA